MRPNEFEFLTWFILILYFLYLLLSEQSQQFENDSKVGFGKETEKLIRIFFHESPTWLAKTPQTESDGYNAELDSFHLLLE